VAVNSLREARRTLATRTPDLVIANVQLTDGQGTEVLAAGGNLPYPVLITSDKGGEQLAVEVMKAGAMDYVLKPVQVDRLTATVQRLKAHQRSFEALARQLRSLGTLAPRAEPLTQVMAGSGNTVQVIPLDAVCYFQSADKYTTVVTAEGESLLRTPLKDLAPQLSRDFQQVHRGTIVNLKEVASAVKDEAGRVVLHLRRRPETLPVSRVYAELFRPM